MDSPFRPGFGKNPPYLAGRSQEISLLEDGLEIGQWAQQRGTLITGLRGVGKTVMLNHAEDIARENGWHVISETANKGFLERITAVHLPALLNSLDPKNPFRVTSINLAGLGSISIEYQDGRKEAPSFRSMAEEVCRLLDSHGGLLFTLDEINTSSIKELSVFAAEYQHLVRSDLEVAFIAAGLKGEVRRLLQSPATTFLRRCTEVPIKMLTPSQTYEAFRKPILDHGRTVSEEVLDYMVRAAQGYPFLVQLIGDYTWRESPQSTEIRLTDVKAGYRRARLSIGGFILEPSLCRLSPVDRSFLAAVASDSGPSRMEDIRRRMGDVDTNYASVYRQRLIDAGIIEPAGHGLVTIALPYLREYLREHIATEMAGDGTREAEGFPPPPEL